MVWSLANCREKREEHFKLLFTDEVLHGQPTEPIDLTAKDRFKILEKLLLTEGKHWLETKTLQSYLDVGRIPRGLRFSKKPTFGKDNSKFMQEWNRIQDECSNDLIRLIIYERNREIKQLEKEILKAIKALEPIVIDTDCSEIEHDLKVKLEYEEDELLKTKHSKFLRDKLDYQQGRQRDWAKKDRGRVVGDEYIPNKKERGGSAHSKNRYQDHHTYDEKRESRTNKNDRSNRDRSRSNHGKGYRNPNYKGKNYIEGFRYGSKPQGQYRNYENEYKNPHVRTSRYSPRNSSKFSPKRPARLEPTTDSPSFLDLIRTRLERKVKTVKDIANTPQEKRKIRDVSDEEHEEGPEHKRRGYSWEGTP
ncbi:uncharacterized protein LOC142487324 [Ascaphus truei]|uniref:uncharacterized protein LOC142487324 n=1 Tax=Ascaphus truei TaxID=8439 RepID=UPI003F5A175F